MTPVEFFQSILEIDYNFVIQTENEPTATGSFKVCITKYGKFYFRNLSEKDLFDCIVFMKAKQMNKEGF